MQNIMAFVQHYSSQTGSPQDARRARFLVDARHDARAMLPLSYRLFQASLRAQNRQALLGRIWLFLPAVAAALAASYVQDRGILNVHSLGLPYPVFVFVGTVLWQTFIEALNTPLNQLSANRSLITRMRCSHEGLILAGWWTALMNAAIRLTALFVLCWLTHVPLAPTILLIPLGILTLAIMGLAAGMLIAPLGLLYDDIRRAVTILTGMLIFIMPIAYPIAATGWQRFNPLLAIINTTRGWLIGPAPLTGFLTWLAVATIVLLGAWLFYRISRPHVVARLG